MAGGHNEQYKYPSRSPGLVGCPGISIAKARRHKNHSLKLQTGHQRSVCRHVLQTISARHGL